jgi:hypothetical protein
MAAADRNVQFEKISGKVHAAREKTTAAWQKTRDQLASEVANAKDKALRSCQSPREQGADRAGRSVRAVARGPRQAAEGLTR